MAREDYREKCLQQKPDACALCGSGEEVDVHHLDGDIANNDLDNLLPVCRGCHNKIHGGDLPLLTSLLKPGEEREETREKRYTLRLTDDRKNLLDEAGAIVARDDHDDPAGSEVIDAALTHLIQSRQNIDDARDELDPRTIQRFNTDVLALKYRTSIDERWR